MIWPPTDSRRTLADDGTVRRLCWLVRLLRCEARGDVVLLHGAAPRGGTVAGAGGKLNPTKEPSPEGSTGETGHFSFLALF